MQLNQIDFVNPLHGEGYSKYGVYCQPYGGEIIRQLVRQIDPSIRFRILDETRGDEMDFQGDVMFGTAYTYPVKRLYRIAQGYRRRGKPVVLGGIHVSMIAKYPELSSKEYGNADAIVVGEGESVVPSLIADLKADRLKPLYQGHPVESDFPVLCEEPLRPGWQFPVQFLRGCPWGCEFCSVPGMFGDRYRQRPLEFILQEVEQYHAMRGPTNTMVSLDDDLNDPKTVYPVLEAIRENFGEVQGGWTSATDMNLVVNFKGRVNHKFLQLASDTNCYSLYFGFENVHPRVLKEEMGVKKNTPKYYPKLAKACHDYGIMAWGSTILSPQSVTWEDVEFMVDWYNSAEIDVMGWSILTPLPGTPLFDKMYREGMVYGGDDKSNGTKVAWLDLDWSKYDVLHTVWLPEGAQYAPEEIEEMREWAMHNYETNLTKSALLAAYNLIRKNTRGAVRHGIRAFMGLKHRGVLPEKLVERAFFGKRVSHELN
ncbi:MAG: B12-binding domain-containing radical SAM protein [Thermoplasmata archaeon]